ncbi:hypothetical protein [Mycobacterium sp.]|uniref:hypothetical protein n=1 Tax=Mycobacterium sp. TaxID=1785 RepID=UPI003CC55FB1
MAAIEHHRIGCPTPVDGENVLLGRRPVELQYMWVFLPPRTRDGRLRLNRGIGMLHELVLAAQSQPEAAGFILRGIKGIFVAIGSIIASIVCAAIAATKGRNPFGWGILGLFFSILTLIVVIVIPSKK